MVAVQVGLGKLRDRGSSLISSVGEMGFVVVVEVVVMVEERNERICEGSLASVGEDLVFWACCCSSSCAEKTVEIVEIESLWLLEKGPEDVVEEGVVGAESMVGEEQLDMDLG